MRKRYEPKDLDKVFDELENANPRAIITVGGSLLEYAVEKCVESRFREPQTKEESSLLFSESGLLGTFSEKILIAYFLKLIGPQTKRDLDLIRLIRNVVAHDMNPVSFDETSEIANRCRELELAKSSIPGMKTPADLKGKFLVTVHFFTGALLLRASEPLVASPLADVVKEALKELGPYLDR